MARIVVVSNRVSINPRGGSRAGGLEVALQEVFKNHAGIWFGWSGRVVKQGEVETRATNSNDNRQTVVTDLTEEDYREYYNGFANRVLWPILHYRLDLAEYSRRDLSGYMRVNEHFASELHKVLKPTDIVWVHDYHLIPLAHALRQRGHKNKIGFFLHIPLPPPEILTALPNHEQLFSTLIHYDLVGFQTDIDSLNCARYLTHECKLASRDLKIFSDGRNTVRLGTFPVGVQTEEMREWADKASQSAIVRRVKHSLVGRAMLIGVDRLDYSKGLVQRMEAFERFLEGNPAWHDKVTYLQITPKSRTKIREYLEIEKAVSSAAGRINGNHGEASWTPIRYINQSYSRATLSGFYRSARVGLVTPLRDGMNLVAKEYVACQRADDPGVLVLSRFAGAAQECQSALLVNPYDSEAVALAIARALAMPQEERIERHQSMMKVLEQNDIKFWGENFLLSLQMTYDEMTMLADFMPPRREPTAKSSPRRIRPN